MPTIVRAARFGCRHPSGPGAEAAPAGTARLPALHRGARQAGGNQLLYTFNNADRLKWVLIHALEGLLPEARAQLLMAAISYAADISILCDVFRAIARDVHEEGAKDELKAITFGEFTDALRENLLVRVKALARTNQIWSQSEPDHILWYWWSCNLQAEVFEFTKGAMKSEEGLRGLLNVTVTLVQSSEGNYEHVGSSWSRIVDLSELAERARELRSSSDENDRRLAQRFLDALERGRNDPF